MTFREFMKKYKKKRKRIEKVCEGFYFFMATLCPVAERHLKKAYNAGYWEGFGEGVEKGWNECESVHKVVDKVRVVEVRNENF